MRRTYRTWQVLGAISDLTCARPGPGPSNREVAGAAGIEDEGRGGTDLLDQAEHDVGGLAET